METTMNSESQVSSFWSRHIGLDSKQIQAMCQELGVESPHHLISQVVPQEIYNPAPYPSPDDFEEYHLHIPLSEKEALERLQDYFDHYPTYYPMIGMGYHPTETPPALQRYLLENPGWYTPYTPYQAEISQGRLELLFHFQTLCSELTGLPLANASLLDEGSAAGEAMSLSLAASKKNHPPPRYFAADHLHPQVLAVLRSRAKGLDVELVISSVEEFLQNPQPVFGGLVGYPDTLGRLWDPGDFIQEMKSQGALTAAATDLLALTLIKPPGEWGFDIALGSAQRLGIPLGFGGPHAAFFATTMEQKRRIPGRLVGRSQDRHSKTAYRLALQTREQHIKRERATSNICTAQALLASMSAAYTIYHGTEGLKNIATEIHRKAAFTAALLERCGCKVTPPLWDTVVVDVKGEERENIIKKCQKSLINIRIDHPEALSFSCSETTTHTHLSEVFSAFTQKSMYSEMSSSPHSLENHPGHISTSAFCRTSTFLSQEVFSRFHSELAFMRYLKELENKDYSLVHGMIPLGSCTMKLNSAAELMPLSWQKLSFHHPGQPHEQNEPWYRFTIELQEMLAQLTGMDAVSLQPNSGAQGEWAGLMTIRYYLEAQGEHKRKVCLIPASAHGTNPASCVMAGFQVVVVNCDGEGNVDFEDLKKKVLKHKDDLAALMITYPSTHGVFEPRIKEVCQLIHDYGGQVYMDGANLNAQVGVCLPGEFGIDVCHINLHKTFCIPHGGGGPGAGPIAVKKHLEDFLPIYPLDPEKRPYSVCASEFGSTLILTISWMYMVMMGEEGLKRATEIAVLSANYMAQKLHPYFPVLYRGQGGFVAHECLLDLRPLTKATSITVEDVAKRLMDYGFHAPTISFPIPGTLMLEPTESETWEEIQGFIQAMISIRKEITAIEKGDITAEDSPLRGAPHPWWSLTQEPWPHVYSRQEACFPLALRPGRKFWPSTSRIDNALGDRQLICACEPWEAYGVSPSYGSAEPKNQQNT